MCTYGITGRLLLHALCNSNPSRFKSIYGRFSRPVLPGARYKGNKVDLTILRREINQWLTAEVMSDTGMAQDFRIAITQLCLDCLGYLSCGEERAGKHGGHRIGIARPQRVLVEIDFHPIL